MPIEILYDRMKTAVISEDDQGHIIYNRSLLALARHYGFQPKACRRTFRNLDDLNAQLRDWLDTVANARLHGTTQKIVAEAFAAEQQELQGLPAFPFDALLRLERRVSHDGLVSIGGNYYSVPHRTRRVVEVHQLPDQLRILDEGRLVAVHPVLEGRRQYRVDPAHRQGTGIRSPRQAATAEAVVVGHVGDRVAQRSLAYYQAIGDRLALAGERP